MITTEKGGLSTCEDCIPASYVSGGGGGVSEIETTVKSANAREAQSWHCAGNELVIGGGGILARQCPPAGEEGHISMTRKLFLLC